jgi:hypothetical protein
MIILGSEQLARPDGAKILAEVQSLCKAINISAKVCKFIYI